MTGHYQQSAEWLNGSYTLTCACGATASVYGGSGGFFEARLRARQQLYAAHEPLPEEQDLTLVRCPMCGSTNEPGEAYLGLLGGVTWFRCRYCGHDWRDDR